MRDFQLPAPIATLIHARNEVRTHYLKKMRSADCDVSLKFTLDGNLVGDIGEAIAVDLFGIKLVEGRSTAGIEGFSSDGKSVQVKATGTGRGPAFRQTETCADHLLFFDLDFENARGRVVFNGPEHYATKRLPGAFSGQRSLSRNQIREADLEVAENERLKPTLQQD